ncbi:hypothetical protein Fcan01_10412 [Folsomia candida]|uniref:Uncharacterized protein n=1 Tax=Folsomia candida TaxID=158441 RepID=A0A226EBM8_FOLCA|nr:hypothetical protein Fcan01_10412 [Folsomia candida]
MVSKFVTYLLTFTAITNFIPNSDSSFVHLFGGMTSCDFLTIYDGIFTENFLITATSHLTRIVKMLPAYIRYKILRKDHVFPFPLDIAQSHHSPCQISVLLSHALFQSGSPMRGKDFTKWIGISTFLHSYFLNPKAIEYNNSLDKTPVRRTFISDTANTYVFTSIKLNSDKDVIMRTMLDPQFKALFVFYDIQRFAFVFLTETTKELCCLTSKSKPSLSETQCGKIKRYENVFQTYFKTCKFTFFWRYINGLTYRPDGSYAKTSKILPSTTHLNPFEYTALFDIYLHVAQIIT